MTGFYFSLSNSGKRADGADQGARPSSHRLYRSGGHRTAEWEAHPKVWSERYSNTPTDSQLMPLRGSVAATAGVAAPGVHTDLYGRSRPLSGAVTAGAVQTV